MPHHGKSWCAALVLVLSFGSCDQLDADDKRACEERADCLDGFSCLSGTCVSHSEGCAQYCAEACDAQQACGLGASDDPCVETCEQAHGGSDCSELEPPDLVPCEEIERDAQCASYCQAVCERGAQCASIEADTCALGCLDEQPSICNSASVPVRDCDHIKVEVRIYHEHGRALLSDDGPSQSGFSTPNVFGLCRTAADCADPLGCSQRTNTCGACEDDADCAGDYGVRQACSAGKCARVECVANADCRDPRSPNCAPELHTCVP